MRAWVETDATGAEVLVRAGTGTVTAVSPGTDVARVEIDCHLPGSWSRTLRYTVEASIPVGHPLLAIAREAEAGDLVVTWSAVWCRHEGVPAHLPIGSLDLATDARATLAELAIVPASDEVAPVVSQHLTR